MRVETVQATLYWPTGCTALHLFSLDAQESSSASAHLHTINLEAHLQTHTVLISSRKESEWYRHGAASVSKTSPLHQAHPRQNTHIQAPEGPWANLCLAA